MSEPFVVEIVSGEALPAKDTSVNVSTRELEHLSDPYVQCELKDAHGNSKGPVRSSVPKLRTLDPVWRFLIDFDVPQGDVMLSDELHIAVYDADRAHVRAVRAPQPPRQREEALRSCAPCVRGTRQQTGGKEAKSG